MKSVNVRIEGRVQGVWYRGWTVSNAKDLKLDGWVRNRRDGSVEAIFAGEPEVVDEMLKRCQNGPDFAKVTAIHVKDCKPPMHFGFKARDTF